MKINKWTITELFIYNKWGTKEYLCICDCGTKHYQQLSTINLNKSKGCMKCTRKPMGKKYGKWTILRDAGLNKHRQIVYRVMCECGFIKNIRKWSLIKGQTKMCGSCAFKENPHRAFKHGLSRTKVYKAWCDMKSRCLNPEHKYFKWYGGKGITIDKRWHQFINFFEDMGHVPEGKQLGRIDVNKSYTKNNTLWTTHKKNMNNRTNSRQPK